MAHPFLTPDRISRIALATIFIWFGTLKLFDVSPASDLIRDLLHMTMPAIPYDGFIIFLGIWEVLIGILFLFPRATSLAFWLMVVQMFTTFGPFVFLPDAVWNSALIPTLEGQYIIKNIALIALGYEVYRRHHVE